MHNYNAGLEEMSKELAIPLESIGYEKNSHITRKERPVKIKAFKVICTTCKNIFKAKSINYKCKNCGTSAHIERV